MFRFTPPCLTSSDIALETALKAQPPMPDTIPSGAWGLRSHVLLRSVADTGGTFLKPNRVVPA